MTVCVSDFVSAGLSKQKPKKYLNFRSKECIGELRNGKYSVTKGCL